MIYLISQNEVIEVFTYQRTSTKWFFRVSNKCNVKCGKANIKYSRYNNVRKSFLLKNKLWELISTG